jgi:hypothetical protein
MLDPPLPPPPPGVENGTCDFFGGFGVSSLFVMPAFLSSYNEDNTLKHTETGK